jgi:hypothetical protein
MLAAVGASCYIERMFDDVEAGVATAVVARLSTVVDELQNLDLTSLPGDDVLAVLRDLEVQKRRLATVDHALIAEIDTRGLAHEHAFRNTAALLTQLVRVSPAEATGRVRAAADLGPRRGLTGQVLPPVFEPVAAAQAAGIISTAHARVVTATIDALPAAVQVEHEQCGCNSSWWSRPANWIRPCSSRSPGASPTPWTPTAPSPRNATVSGAGT